MKFIQSAYALFPSIYLPYFFFCNWFLHTWNEFYTWSQSKISFSYPLIIGSKFPLIIGSKFLRLLQCSYRWQPSKIHFSTVNLRSLGARVHERNALGRRHQKSRPAGEIQRDHHFPVIYYLTVVEIFRTVRENFPACVISLFRKWHII